MANGKVGQDSEVVSIYNQMLQSIFAYNFIQCLPMNVKVTP